jgi:hypothetical protein
MDSLNTPRPLLPLDLGVAPLWLMRGRPALVQVVLLHIWQAELRGDKWSLSGLGRDAGTTPHSVKNACELLEREGLLMATNEARAPYRANAEFLPVRPVPVAPVKPPPGEKREPTFPGWVWSALKIWRHRVGMIGPQKMFDGIDEAVNEYGEDKVLRGLDAYASETEARFASPKAFAERVNTWVG